ncbi:regulator of microtubule dynamics protein 1-like isoform X2 [Dendronephthya gigantea]|uniref:regulator of microtubule dynamics protein 1-like isoform X2 n=1 Tax=Dendronephthya gigantea TaxID=151771 RepID=UPI00106C8497|nr:regulator of microtubule dynamics protein 1-like isoform X2 [Dendronephthya gigantea]
MLSRTIWLRILKRYKGVQGMESTSSLPSNVKRCFFIGLGIGTGVAVGAYVVKKISEQNSNREVVLALNQVTNEIKELRVSMVQHFERTASAFSNEQALTSKRKYNRVNVSRTVIGEPGAMQVESSSEDDFFDLFDEDIESEQLGSESLQDRSILNLDELIKKCDELSENDNATDNAKEMSILEDLLTRNADNVEVLLRCARAYASKANFVENAEERKEVVFKGLEYGAKSVEILEDHPKAQKWYAVLLGMAAGLATLTEQVPLATKFKRHTERAIELNPEDSTNYFLLGRFCFELANLSWWQRQAVNALYTDAPTTSYEEALSHFQQAEKLGYYGLKSNWLFIGKCYKALGDLEKAKQWLKKSLEMPVKDYDDRASHEEATTIMQTL